MVTIARTIVEAERLDNVGTMPNSIAFAARSCSNKPSSPAPAEQAFLTAIGIARRQKARSFELRAALKLAKLHRATERPAEAHAVLAPALEGFRADARNARDRRGAGAAGAIEAGPHVRHANKHRHGPAFVLLG